jgi:hypothetical protein
LKNKNKIIIITNYEKENLKKIIFYKNQNELCEHLTRIFLIETSGETLDGSNQRKCIL